jgi:hypothetical protein
LAHGSGAQLSVLSVYDYGDAQPDALSLPLEDISRSLDTQMQRTDAQMETKMKAFLAGVPTHEPPMTPLLKVGNRFCRKFSFDSIWGMISLCHGG